MILAIQQLVAQIPPGHPEAPGYQQMLGASFLHRYGESGDLNDLEASVNSFQTALDITPEDHPNRPNLLQNLAVSFTERFRRLGDLKDLEASEMNLRAALDQTPEGHPNRPDRLQNLAASFTDRYRRLGDLNDLETALQMKQEVINLTPPGHPYRLDRLNNLAISLRHRYQRLGNMKDLEASLEMKQEVVDLTPTGHPSRPDRLGNLAVSFRDKYQRLGELKDLEAALQTKQEAVHLTPDGHPALPNRLHNLAVSLMDRYRRLGDLKDLQVAMQTEQQALDKTPGGHPSRAERLRSLSTAFTDRYRRLGDLKDLQAALKTTQEAVDLTPQGHPDLPHQLLNLSVIFMDRYQRLGDLKDLQNALQTNQEFMDLIPQGHPDHAHGLQTRSVVLRERYRRLGNLKDLTAAIQTIQEAVDLTPDGHPDRPGRLENLSAPLRDRYLRLGGLDDLDASVQNSQTAVNLTPLKHPNKAGLLRSLATSYGERYKKLGNLADLEASVKSLETAVALTPEVHPEQPIQLQTLALSLIYRYRILGDLEDLEAIHRHYSDSFKFSPSSPETSWQQALQWASFAEESQSVYCVPAYLAAFALLPEILWLGHSIPVRHDAIHRLDISKATSSAIRTCINQTNLHAAVEILEQGLATISQQMLQLKTEVDALPADQGEKLLALSSQLYSGILDNPVDIAADRNNLLAEIRKQSGFENFLRPKPYNVLCYASQVGPVVILTNHQGHCNGIIILNPTSEPVHVSLPAVTQEVLKSQGDELKELLGRCNVRNRGRSSSSRLFGHREQFSHKSVKECFEDMLNWLKTDHGISSGRLWWLPTGAFTGLPLHAGQPSDEFIHSYTPTLGSLLDAYAKKPTNTAPTLGVVGVTYTDSRGSNALNGVSEEVKKIVSIVKDTRVQSLVGEQATVDAVKLQLQDCSWVHFACHGCQNLHEPAKSLLQLYGGDLELETILHMPLLNADFVFLAACQTAMGDAQLVNESLHLGGGFIAAGFRSAIGTMWSMNDADGPTVAEIVYSHLFRENRQPQASDAAEA
ncbi:CHAT domain-containing protein, partial [Mycena rebaudengoi]